MKKNRGVSDARNLTNGPGKLTKAFGIDKRHDGLDLTKDEARADLIGKELVGKLGEGYSDTLRTIIMNWLSEKGYFTKGEKSAKK